jgi:hypothetical protein
MIFGTLFTLAGALAGCTTAPVAVPVAGHFNGSDPGLKNADRHLINSQQELVKLGSKDLLKQKFDFEHNSLIVVSLGTQPSAAYWTRIAAVQRKGHHLFVQVLINQPDAAQAATKKNTNPYDAVLIAKATDVKLRVEETNLQGVTPPSDATLPALIAVPAKPVKPSSGS